MHPVKNGGITVDHDQLRNHLANFISAYTFGRRLKTLKSLTPDEFICKKMDNRIRKIHCRPDPSNAGTEQLIANQVFGNKVFPCKSGL